MNLMVVRKNPWVAVVLNFIFPGLGYFYAGKKHIFVSLGFFILSIWVAFHDYNEYRDVIKK